MADRLQWERCLKIEFMKDRFGAPIAVSRKNGGYFSLHILTTCEDQLEVIIPFELKPTKDNGRGNVSGYWGI